jgi:hypothetical protein
MYEASALKDESLRLSVEIMRILENKHVRMHAADYRGAAAHLMETLRVMGIVRLLHLARSRHAVLSDAAEAVLFELRCDHLVDESELRTDAARLTAELIARLKSRSSRV